MGNTYVSLIEYINQSDRELFHSRSIAWLINNNEFDFSSFLKKIDGIKNNDQIDFIYALNEIEQIDILIIYNTKNNQNYRYLHIENKLKSSESSKKLSKEQQEELTQINFNCGKDLSEKLSQTEYYYLRLFCNSTQKKLFNKLKRDFQIISDGISNIKENWRFIYLTPGGNLNNSVKKPINEWGLSIGNPWISQSYKELILNNCEKINFEYADNSVCEYLRFIKKEFTLEGELTSVDFSKQNISNTLLGKHRTIETYIIEQKFKSLVDSIGDNLYPNISSKHEEINYKTKSEFKVGSSNRPSYILNCFFTIDGFYFSSNNNCDQLNIGYQYEHIDEKAKIKLYVSANDYDNTIFKKDSNEKNEYLERSNDFLKNNFKLSKEKYSIENVKLRNTQNTLKTFRSLPIEINEFNNEDELIEIFKDRMKTLAQDLGNLSIDDIEKFRGK